MKLPTIEDTQKVIQRLDELGIPRPVMSAGARGSAFVRWTAGDGDEDVKRLAWDAGRAPLLAALREIYEIATRHKRASDLKRYLLADLESIERHSSPTEQS
jgi:hypothetical protein